MFLRPALSRLGAWLGKRPWAFLAGSVALVVASFILFYLLPHKIVVTFDEGGFVRVDAESNRANELQISFFNGGGKPWYMGVFGEPRDPGNYSIMNPPLYNELKTFYRSIKKDIVLKSDERGNLTFLDFCGNMCSLNEPLFKAVDVLDSVGWLFGNKLRWPVTQVMSYNANIGKHLFLRKENPENREIIDADLGAVYFMMFINGTDLEEALSTFEQETYKAAALHNANTDAKTRITVHSALGMQSEIKRGISFAGSYIVAGFLLMLAVALLGAFCIARTNGRADRGLLILFPLAALIPLFATLSACALCSVLTVPYNTLFFLTPFVSIALSMDGVLHLLQAWLDADRERIHDSNESQMSHVFASFLPSVLINCIVFFPLLLGVHFPIEAYANLFLMVSLTAVFALIYLIFFFCPLLALLFPARKHQLVDSYMDEPACKACHKRIVGWMANFLASSVLIRLAALTVWCIIAAIAVFGLRTRVHANLDYRGLLLPNSPATKGASIMTDVVWPDILHILFFVEQPPDFTDPEQFKQFKKMLDEMEHLPYAMGRDADMTFIYDYLRFTGSNLTADSLNMTAFRSFITHEVYSAWNSGVQYTWKPDNTPQINRMLLMVAFNGTDSLAGKTRLISQCRQIASHFPQFDMVSFDTEVAMVDVLLEGPSVAYFMPPILFVLLFLSFLLLSPNLLSAIVTCFACVSLYYGTFGLAVMFGIHMQPFTIGMLFFLSCITGRLIVHIVFHYHAASYFKDVALGDSITRMEITLMKTLLPTLFSSFVGSLLLLPALISPLQIFVNIAGIVTIHLILGLLHSFLFVPALLTAIPKSLLGRNCIYTKH